MRFRIKTVSALAVMAMAMLAQVAGAQQDQRSMSQPGWLGVSIQDITADLREALPRNVEEGALINSVSPDSPAAKAGLREGDVVLSVDGERVADSDDLTRLIREAGADSRVRLDYFRNGRRNSTTVQLGSAADSRARDMFERETREPRRQRERSHRAPHDLRFFDGGNWLHDGLMAIGHTKPRLGVRMMDLGDQMAEYFSVTNDKGALVTEVLEDSPAEAAGIKAGDVITGLDDRKVESSDALRKALKSYDEGGDVEVSIVRKGRSQSLTVALEEIERPGYRSFLGTEGGVMPLAPMAPGSDHWRSEMKELREELKELRKELLELRSDLR